MHLILILIMILWFINIYIICDKEISELKYMKAHLIFFWIGLILIFIIISTQTIRDEIHRIR